MSECNDNQQRYMAPTSCHVDDPLVTTIEDMWAYHNSHKGAGIDQLPDHRHTKSAAGEWYAQDRSFERDVKLGDSEMDAAKVRSIMDKIGLFNMNESIEMKDVNEAAPKIKPGKMEAEWYAKEMPKLQKKLASVLGIAQTVVLLNNKKVTVEAYGRKARYLGSVRLEVKGNEWMGKYSYKDGVFETDDSAIDDVVSVLKKELDMDKVEAYHNHFNR